MRPQQSVGGASGSETLGPRVGGRVDVSLEVDALPTPSAAERYLLDWLQKERRETCEIGPGLPEPGDPDRRLRASLVRRLVLGRIDSIRLPETGLSLAGAEIVADAAAPQGLDLDGAVLGTSLALLRCRLAQAPSLIGARIEGLVLDGSTLPDGLAAERLVARGLVSLAGCTTGGPIDLTGATLGSVLNLAGARLSPPAGLSAIMADGIELGSDLILQDAHVTGEVSILSAQIRGDLNGFGLRLEVTEGTDALSADTAVIRDSVILRGAVVTGEVRLIGARIGNRLDCSQARFVARSGGRALNLDTVQVGRTFLLCDGTRVTGLLDLTAARIGTICDEVAAWPAPRDLVLDRCRYDAFAGRAPVSFAARADWLSRQDAARWGQEFWPGTWEECARVLRALGHSSTARALLIEGERRQRRARRHGLRRIDPRRWVLWTRDAILRLTVGYGRQPLRAFAFLLAFALIGVGVFGWAERAGAMRPATALIQRAPEWVLCDATPAMRVPLPSLGRVDPGLARPGERQYDCFRRQPEAEDYPRFSAPIYALDTLIPVVSFEMQTFWQPDDGSEAGAWVRRYLWLHIALGWALTLLSAAGFSGLIRTDSS